MKKRQIAIFEGKKIRRVWDDDKEKWFFAVVDVIAVLTDSVNPQSYWKVLKFRLKKEGSQVVTKCNQLKMQASDGKYYQTDAGDTETIFRLIQSIPSPKAEPFKLWLARDVARRGGRVARVARKRIEKETRTSVITSRRFLSEGRK